MSATGPSEFARRTGGRHSLIVGVDPRRRGSYAADWISISLATVVGRGIRSPNSLSVCRWPSIASRILCSVSSRVLPVVMQPGSACSKMTAYLTSPLSSQPLQPLSDPPAEALSITTRRGRSNRPKRTQDNPTARRNIMKINACTSAIRKESAKTNPTTPAAAVRYN